MISVDRVSISFGGQYLFREISFLVNSKDKIGLVGRNGAGKTTLFKVFMGLHAPDEGRVMVPGDIRLGYLPQQMVITDIRTLFEEAETAFDEIQVLEKEIVHLNAQVAERTDYESADYLDLLEQLSEKSERFHLLDTGSRDQRIEQVLLGLGFERSDFGRATREFSGGWRMRIELAKILLKSPDVILLDEPTNHLDIDSIGWLEQFLFDYHGAVLLISHDRVFLDRVTNRTVEIVLGSLHDYRVPYSKYVSLRQERREQQLAAYRNQQKLIADTRDFIERFRYKNTKAVQVQSRIKMLDKLDIIEVDEEDSSSMNIRFPASPRSGSVVLTIRELTAGYDKRIVLHEAGLTLQRGEKVAFVGRNGEGKTTLSRIIAGELPHKGELKLGHNVALGYFAQNQDELLNGERTVLDTLDEVAVGEVRTKIRDILGAFLFSGSDVDKKVKVLSGGERSRLALARLLLEPCNLLILDEPTNHLDMRSKDILKKALLAYDGTLIVVSHDREFLDGLVTKIYEFGNQTIREHIGGIYEFLQRKKMDSLDQLQLKRRNAETGAADAPGGKVSFREKKDHDRELRKLENQISRAEESITRLETDMKEIENQMSEPGVLDNGLRQAELFEQYGKAKASLQQQVSVWEALNTSLEELKNRRI